MTTLYAVTYTEAKRIRDVIPDQVYFSEDRAKAAAHERKILTGLEDPLADYIVIPLTIRDQPLDDIE